ncbi:hypothetical protein AAHA92_32023 [Salvia divinorum]|uniref:Uncharacterized protein n=1 Tax=Salvia divinorum TaxID=28513 RepID=A0ABD1FJC0_SALDI
MSRSEVGNKRRARTVLAFSLAFLLLILSQPSAAAAEWSPARKARLHHRHARGSTPSSQKVYEEDKRLIHTGPNPLHN